jgi:hypothetical protein
VLIQRGSLISAAKINFEEETSTSFLWRRRMRRFGITGISKDQSRWGARRSPLLKHQLTRNFRFLWDLLFLSDLAPSSEGQEALKWRQKGCS